MDLRQWSANNVTIRRLYLKSAAYVRHLIIPNTDYPYDIRPDLRPYSEHDLRPRNENLDTREQVAPARANIFFGQNKNQVALIIDEEDDDLGFYISNG